MGMSAAVMVGSMAVQAMMAPDAPKIAPPPAPIAPPQAAAAPNLQAIQSGVQGVGQAGGSAGIMQTMLTGAGGVNPNRLDLNRTTLLGS